MIDYQEVKYTLKNLMYKSHPGKVLVERIETNKHGTTYAHKHWVLPDQVNFKTDKILSGNTQELADEKYSYEIEKEYSPWLGSLPKPRIGDLNSYTSSRYMYINGTMRNTLTEELSETELKRVNSEIAGITKALSTSEVKKPLTVYRRMEKEWLPKFTELFKSGKLFEDKGFMSTTIIRGSFKGNDENGVPLNHLNEKNGYVEMIIHIPKCKGMGGYVRPISDYKSEFEFLINCNSLFKITNIEQSKDNEKVHFIHMELVGRSPLDIEKR